MRVRLGNLGHAWYRKGAITIADAAPQEDGDDGSHALVGVERAAFKGGVRFAFAAPIVLDMDGDGVVSLIAAAASGARLDPRRSG